MLYLGPLPVPLYFDQCKWRRKVMALKNKDKNPSDLSVVEKAISTLWSVLFLQLDKMEK